MTNPNDPASPIFRTSDYSQDIACTSPGLTKRELFAAMAMQSFSARVDSNRFEDATDAVNAADALIAALN